MLLVVLIIQVVLMACLVATDIILMVRLGVLIALDIGRAHQKVAIQMRMFITCLIFSPKQEGMHLKKGMPILVF